MKKDEEKERSEGIKKELGEKEEKERLKEEGSKR